MGEPRPRLRVPQGLSAAERHRCVGARTDPASKRAVATVPVGVHRASATRPVGPPASSTAPSPTAARVAIARRDSAARPRLARPAPLAPRLPRRGRRDARRASARSRSSPSAAVAAPRPPTVRTLPGAAAPTRSVRPTRSTSSSAAGRVMDPESGFDTVADVGIDGGPVTAIDARDAAPRARRRSTPPASSSRPGFIDILSYEPNPYGIWFKIADGVTTNLGLHGLRSRAVDFFDRRTAPTRSVRRPTTAARSAIRGRDRTLGLGIDDAATSEQIDALVAQCDEDLQARLPRGRLRARVHAGRRVRRDQGARRGRQGTRRARDLPRAVLRRRARRGPTPRRSPRCCGSRTTPVPGCTSSTSSARVAPTRCGSRSTRSKPPARRVSRSPRARTRTTTGRRISRRRASTPDGRSASTSRTTTSRSSGPVSASRRRRSPSTRRRTLCVRRSRSPRPMSARRCAPTG